MHVCTPLAIPPACVYVCVIPCMVCVAACMYICMYVCMYVGVYVFVLYVRRHVCVMCFLRVCDVMCVRMCVGGVGLFEFMYGMRVSLHVCMYA